MPASALLKFVQGATVGGNGQALVGVLTTSVSISNVNNTNVQSWQIDLAYADPTSALVAITSYASNDASATPAASFVPDVRRSYRWVLKVWSVPNRVGQPDSIDIRQFTVRELNGVIITAPMIWPLPLPDPRTGEPNAKPSELNFGGQLDGWHGTGSDGLMSQVLAKHLPPIPGNPGDVLTVSGGRWVSAAPVGGGGNMIGPGSSVANNVPVFLNTDGVHLVDSGLSLAAFIRKDGSVTYTGNQSMGGFKLTSVAPGTTSGDAVNYGQLQAAIAGLDPKGNVRALSLTNVASLSGLGPVGGVASFTDGQRVALGGQSIATQNGIWVVHPLAWTRPLDFNTGMDVSGAYFFVEEGTNADRGFLIQSDEGSAIVDTSNLTLSDFGTSSISAGNGLQKAGNIISVLLDGATLSASVAGLKVSTAGITSNELAVASVNLASTTVTGLLPFANIANGAARSVLGRSANSIGVMASIAASTDGQVLRAAGGVIGWGALDLSDVDAVTGTLPIGNLATLTGLSVLGRAATSTGVMTAITGLPDEVLRVNTAGTALGFGQVATGGIATAAVTLSKLANGTANSVIGRIAATSGPYSDISASADGQVLRRAAGLLGWGAVDLADTDAVTGLLPFANIANGSATSVLARAAGTAGVMASLAATADGQFLQRAAGALTWGGIAPASITGGTAVGQVLTNAVGNVPTWGAVDLADADAVTGLLPFANLTSGAATSVLGRSAGTAGVMASIAATVDGHVLQRVGGALVFAAVGSGGLAGGTAVGQVLTNAVGNVPTWGAVDLADTDAVTGLLPFANIADGSANSVLGRSAATSGVLAPIAASADGQVLRLTAGVVGFGAIDLTDADAVAGQLPFANLANGTATSVLARASATGGVMASLAATADGQFLQRVGGALTWAAFTLSNITGGTAVGQVLTNAVGNVPTWGAVDLADADAVTGLLPFSNMPSLPGLSALGRSADTTGVMAAMTAAVDGQVLRRSGTVLAFGTVATAGIADSNVTLAKLVNGSASSVLGRSAATSGVYADIVSSVDGQVLRRGAAGVIGWGAVDLADADAVTGLLPFANIANGTGLSVLGRSATTSGVMAPIVGTAGTVLQVNAAGTALVFATVDSVALADGSVPLGKLADGTAASVVGRAGTTAGVHADIASSADGQVLRRVSGVLSWGAVDLADTDAVIGLLPFANIANGSALSVLGRGTNSAGVMASIAGTASTVLQVNSLGTALVFAALDPATITNATVPLGKLVDGAAASVIGRSAATTGAHADIASSADGQVLVRSAGTLGWGAVNLADTDAVTGLLPFANIASLAGLSVFGRSANTTGVMAAITGTDGQVLRVSGTTLGFGTIALTGLANATASSVLGRSAATSGAYADITSSADGQVLRRGASGVIAFGAVNLADADAVTGLLPGTNVNPNFGSQNIISTGNLQIGTANTAAIRMPNNSEIYSVDTTGTLTISLAYVSTSGSAIFGDLDAVSIGLVSGGGSVSIGAQVMQLENGITQLRFSAATAASVRIFHDTTATASATGQVLLINAQNASGTNSIGGELQLRSGTGTLTAGALRLYSGSVNSLTIFGTSLDVGVDSVTFANGLTGPTISQASVVTASYTGATFTWAAQSCVGGSSIGGNLLAKSGTGTTKAGSFTWQVGNSVMVQGVDLGSGREVLGLLGAITTSEMPANTGDRVLILSKATAIPTANPIGVYVFFADDNGVYIRCPSGNIQQLVAN